MKPLTAAQRCALIAADGGLTRYQVGRWYPTGMGPPFGRAYGSGAVLALVRRGFLVRAPGVRFVLTRRGRTAMHAEVEQWMVQPVAKRAPRS